MEFINNLLHNCEETSLNIVKSKETSLSVPAWLKMKFHIAFCKCCRNFGKQNKAMDKALQNQFHGNISMKETKASDELKNRIKENLQKM
ncbi:hypothetical protein [Chryseobacterium profundimaris]|uniref:Glycine dehydrogenase n=1 Tax=Chryseobacterium profundimaris TaxID=1387275 RepID=A0ABY1PAL5_9FLAO|nr:hypothetical protein [Chryseobacterium profundimaris]SMP30020.1 hypothetical protein SAMN06264346_11257 [Chryseobacterium profundimaris]